MRLFIIRHADPDYPNNTITPAGHLEARALAKRLKFSGMDKIYCSPLGRAVDTMRYTAEALNLHYDIQPWTAELAWPQFEQPVLGKSVIWDIHGHLVHQEETWTRNNWHQLPPFNHSSDYFEGFTRLQENSDLFLQTLGFQREEGRYRILRSNREKIGIFCHGGFGLSWLAHLLRIPPPLIWSGFFLPTSSVTTVLFDERSPEFATPRCLGVGDISHLHTEGLPMQPAGIKCNRD